MRLPLPLPLCCLRVAKGGEKKTIFFSAATERRGLRLDFLDNLGFVLLYRHNFFLAGGRGISNKLTWQKCSKPVTSAGEKWGWQRFVSINSAQWKQVRTRYAFFSLGRVKGLFFKRPFLPHPTPLPPFSINQIRLKGLHFST